MGYAEKMQKLCAARGIDQAALAARFGLSRSSMSRILSGVQEPKLRLAYELAQVLGVTLDYLMDDTQEDIPSGHWLLVSEDELTILKLVRRLGNDSALDRLLGLGATPPGGATREEGEVSGGREAKGGPI